MSISISSRDCREIIKINWNEKRKENWKKEYINNNTRDIYEYKKINKKFVTVLAHIHMCNDNNNSKPNSHSRTQIFPAFQLFLLNTFQSELLIGWIYLEVIWFLLKELMETLRVIEIVNYVQSAVDFRGSTATKQY